MLVSLPLPCTQWHNGDLLLVRGPLAWSGQRWEEGSVASIGGTNGQLGHRGGRITEHCHRSTLVQTLHRSLHQEPSRILIASGLPYMKLQACLLDLPPRMHSTTHDFWHECNNVACPGWGGDTRAGDADVGPSMINKYCDLGDTETRHYNVTPDLLMWPLLRHNQPLWARCGDTHPCWPRCLCGEMGDQIFSDYWLHLPRPASYFVSEINDHLWNWSFVSSVQCSSSSAVELPHR